MTCKRFENKLVWKTDIQQGINTNVGAGFFSHLVSLKYIQICIYMIDNLKSVPLHHVYVDLLNDTFTLGLGYSMIIVSALISFYYNVVIAVCIHFFFASMTSKVPWASCDDESWATCYCRDSSMNQTDPDPWNNTRPDCGMY